MLVELILKTKVEGLGVEADVVSVKPGYARNFLIPKDFAAPATQATKRQIEELKKKRAEREAQEFNQAQEFAGKLGKTKLAFTLTAGSGQDKVFGAVTAQDIALKLKEAGFEIDKKKIDLPKPIKDLGAHEVIIHLGAGVQAKINVEVASASAKVEKPDNDDEGGRRPAKRPSKTPKKTSAKAEKSE
jgi:large subunit ribosomal protein L9